MILKMNNKCEGFYTIMGKIFGSRIVENETHDRIYDDNNKEWYVYIDNDSPVACVSIVSNVIKNVYCIKEEFLVELLQYIKEENNIKESIVTNTYVSAYEQSGLIVDTSNEYKNFIVIRSQTNG